MLGIAGSPQGKTVPAPRPRTFPSSAPLVSDVTSRPSRRRASRLLDLVIAAAALVLLSPLAAVVAVLIRCTSPGPVLFRQVRLGQARQPFVMLKFRSMYADTDDRLHRDYVCRLLAAPVDGVGTEGSLVEEGLYKLAHDPRITPVGRWLRGTSLDELPQLVNVLRGDMAIVGPRPVLAWEAALFDPRHEARFQVLPGMTGLWQTSGRNRLTMTQALDLDVEYAERASLHLDIEILLKTIPVVLTRRGVR